MHHMTGISEHLNRSDRLLDRFNDIYLKHSLLVRWPVGALAIGVVILMVGNVFNAWILYAGLRRQCELLRGSAFNTLIAKQSLEKVFLGVVVCPIMLYWFVKGGPTKTILQRELCFCATFMIIVIQTIGLCNNALIAFNRLLSCHPHWKIASKLSSVRATLWMIGGTWLLCGAPYFLTFMVYMTLWKQVLGCWNASVDDFSASPNVRPFDPTPLVTTIRSLYSCIVVLTLTVCFICYTLIIHKLFSKEDRATQLSSRRKRGRKRALLVIMLVFMIYLLCGIPNMLTIVWRLEVLDQQPLFICLTWIEAVASSLLYMFTVPTLRPPWCQKKQNSISVLEVQSAKKTITSTCNDA